MKVPPELCLVLEDTPSIVKAAIAADMWCIAVATPLTRESVHALDILEERWIVDDPDQAARIVKQMVTEWAQD